MIPQNVFELLAHYHLWMDERLYKLADTIADDERRVDRGAFFKSIHGTFNHLLFGNLRWMGRFLEQTLTEAEIGEILYESFDDLRHEHLQCDRMILEWTEGLSDDWLQQDMVFASGVYQKRWVLPRWVFVMHMFNHQTHHRGQLTTLLSQQGLDPGITDIPCLPELESGIVSELL